MRTVQNNLRRLSLASSPLTMTCRQPRKLSRVWNFAAESFQNSGRGIKSKKCLTFIELESVLGVRSSQRMTHSGVERSEQWRAGGGRARRAPSLAILQSEGQLTHRS